MLRWPSLLLLLAILAATLGYGNFIALSGFAIPIFWLLSASTLALLVYAFLTRKRDELSG